jgi:uncharacterized protein (DUF2062 family)
MKTAKEKKTLRQHFVGQIQKFKQLQGNPRYLARGVAVGVFIGFAPVMPFKSVLIITLTVLLSGSTIAGLIICTLICNPLTYVPLYYIAWYIGDLLLPGRASWEVLHTTVLTILHSSMTDALAQSAQLGLQTVIVMLAGGCLIGVPFALASYPIAYRIFFKRGSDQ